jgi:lipopolysaccharide export system protein LptA
MTMKKFSGLFFAVALIAGTAQAQTQAQTAPVAAPAVTPAAAPAGAGALNPNKNQPIDITADQTLEWHRNELQYIGRGNVIAKQGDATIKSDTLTADYRQTDTSKNDIYRLTAVGNVTVSQDDDNAIGDHAVYTTDDGVAIMTGKHLVMTTPDQVVTARDNFRYEVNSGRLTANGAARAIRTMDDGTKDIIDADQLSAWFVQQQAGGPRKLDHMTAVGHVVITTPTDVLHGDTGDYVAGSQIATVTGHVRIDRGPNVLVGDKADINLATNVSRMVTTPGQSKRVHGIFYPGSDKPGAPVKTPGTAAPGAQTAAPAEVKPADTGPADKAAQTAPEKDTVKKDDAVLSAPPAPALTPALPAAATTENKKPPSDDVAPIPAEDKKPAADDAAPAQAEDPAPAPDVTPAKPHVTAPNE